MRSLAALLVRSAPNLLLLLVVLSTNIPGDALVERLAARRSDR